MLFSLSKSFTSTAIGLAISEGLLIIDDPVIGFFSQEQLPSDISNELKEMTVRHLLTMISGHGQCALTGRQTAKFQGGVKHILAQPVVH
jgi:CubicO group peptidase (beta-lactamase class C family)